jgi:hypothetical protein
VVRVCGVPRRQYMSGVCCVSVFCTMDVLYAMRCVHAVYILCRKGYVFTITIVNTMKLLQCKSQLLPLLPSISSPVYKSSSSEESSHAQ